MYMGKKIVLNWRMFHTLSQKQRRQTINSIIAITTAAVLLFFTSIYLSKRYFEYFTSKSHCKVTFIISRYEESLSWIKNLPLPPISTGHDINIVIYNKGSTDIDANIASFLPSYVNNLTIKKIDNIGRCDHSYIHYIHENYDDLHGCYIFISGSCYDIPYKWYKTTKTVACVFETCDTCIYADYVGGDISQVMANFKLENWTASHPTNMQRNNVSKLIQADIRPYGKWYENQFDDIGKIEYVCYGGILSAHSKHIKHRPRSFYRNLLTQLSKGDNVEVGHYVERSWLAIFHPVPAKCIKSIESYAELHSIPIYIVSMDRRPHRRQEIISRIKDDPRYHIAMTAAVDGHKLFEVFITKPGEAGCFLSHLMMWKAFLKTDAPFAFILEDDADIQLPEQWHLIDSAVKHTPNNWEIIWLGSTQIHYPSKNTRVNEHISVNRSVLFGTHAYLISNAGAKHLYNKYKRLEDFKKLSEFSKYRQIDVELSELLDIAQYIVNDNVSIPQLQMGSDTFFMNVPS